MQFRRLRRGMTLVELMAVVAIIAVLASIMAIVMLSDDNSNAYSELPKEITTLFETQRMRAMTMSVPAYIIFDIDDTQVRSIEPRLGANNGFTVCAVENPSLGRQMIPLQYNANDGIHVAIDITTENQQRTIDAQTSNKYKTATNAFTRVTLKSKINTPVTDTIDQTKSVDVREKEEGTVVSKTTIACFQPNGMVYFIQKISGNWGVVTNMDKLTLNIEDAKQHSPGLYVVSVNSLGMIRSTNRLRE